MKTHSVDSFRWVRCMAFGALLAACGDDPAMMMEPVGTAGTSAGTAAGGGAAGMTNTPAAGSGTAGRGTAGTPAGAGGASAGTGGTSAGAGGAAAGTGGTSAGTGGASAGTGGAGGAGGGGTGGTGGGGATFTQVYGLIMTGCGCHVTGNSGGLSMSSKMSAYTNLVDADSTSCSGEKRVVAGSPEDSVFFHSIDRTNLGNCSIPQMPRGAGKWSAANIETVRAWIMAGAMNN